VEFLNFLVANASLEARCIFSIILLHLNASGVLYSSQNIQIIMRNVGHRVKNKTLNLLVPVAASLLYFILSLILT
jgi:hypothetical protein